MIDAMKVDIDADKPREECGVFALHLPEAADIAGLCHLGLFALQHRGQESCGICVSNGEDLIIEKDMGLVSEVFTETRLDGLRLEGARTGLAHNRYSTTGSSLRFNAQPLTVRSNKGVIALAHNGNFTNAKKIRKTMLDEGAVFQTTNDSEVMINLVARYSHLSLEDATAKVMGELAGGFAVVLMLKGKILGLRDAGGVRPLVIGELDGGHVFASEPSALHVIGATFLRDVNPGELVIADDAGLHSRQVLAPKPTPCAFEWIYFARGDSVLDGVDVHASRIRMGETLAREAPAEADVVIGVPDSGLPAAIGYARASGIPYDMGLYKSPYAGRTFISPNQRLRELKVKLKLAPTAAVKGKRVVLVDDSIVRGTTSGRIVQLLRDAGAKEVHFRVSSPPIKYPCYYGIDTAARKELAAATMSVEEIRASIGADSLYFISEAGLARAIALPRTCLACFTGDYPAGHPGEESEKEGLELPLFSATS
ncbi:MAG: amidophosphoribosyltransferase [Deinococcota bacterium]|jgi:amidophosphoribosyltransferase|nr:amidophosphoribosyltransferase [Deinococcota bacterium]